MSDTKKKKVLIVSSSGASQSISADLSARAKSLLDITETTTLQDAEFYLLRHYDLAKAAEAAPRKFQLSPGDDLSIDSITQSDGHLVVKFRKSEDGKDVLVDFNDAPTGVKAGLTSLEDYSIAPAYDAVLVDENLFVSFAGSMISYQLVHGGFIVKGLAELARIPTIGVRVESDRHKWLHSVRRHDGQISAICFTSKQMMNGHGQNLERQLFGIEPAK